MTGEVPPGCWSLAVHGYWTEPLISFSMRIISNILKKRCPDVIY